MLRIGYDDLTMFEVDDAAGSPLVMLDMTDWLELEGSIDDLKDGDSITHSMRCHGPVMYYSMKDRLGVGGTLKWSDGVRTVTAETVITQVSAPMKFLEMIMLDVTHILNGAVTIT